MDSRLIPSLFLAIVLTSALTLPASAAGLYKTVDSDGAILFSDAPPPSDARIVAQGRTDAATGAATAPGMLFYELAESDGAVARANAIHDLAEHALAVARQGFSSPRDGLRMAASRRTQGDVARVAFYQKGVQAARRQLMDLLRERQAPALQLASR